jgi:flagellar motility protein MotE (MotC chaperone)
MSGQESQKPVVQVKLKGEKTRHGSRLGLIVICLLAGVLLVAHSSLLVAQNSPAKPEERKTGAEAKTSPGAKAVDSIEGMADDKKHSELAEKEEALKKEEDRLKALKKELDEKIDKYTKLLVRMEEALKSMETVRGSTMDNLIKAYEAMPNEEAAARLSVLDEQAAIKILVRMKTKKAGAIMAAMEPRKAAVFTEGIMGITKKFPTK